jgi:hypothetical protein
MKNHGKHLERVVEDCRPLNKQEIRELNEITQNQYKFIEQYKL